MSDFKRAGDVVRSSMSTASRDQSQWRAPAQEVVAVVVELTPETRALLVHGVRKAQMDGRLNFGMPEAAQEILAWVARTEDKLRAACAKKGGTDAREPIRDAAERQIPGQGLRNPRSDGSDAAL